MRYIFLLFILVPIVEIGVFIQVGDLIGLTATLLVVLITAIIGVNLLKQQGLKAWTDIQAKIVQGQVPALEMASAAQLLFAGGLLLTPGFVTDLLGFALMVPAIRMLVARQLSKNWVIKTAGYSQQNDYRNVFESVKVPQTGTASQNQPEHKSNRIIEGEFEESSFNDSVSNRK